MARPISLSTSDVSVSAVAPLDLQSDAPFCLSVNTVVTGTATYTLQYTSDDVQASGFVAASANWKNHPQMTGATISDFVQMTAPCTAVRLNQTVGTGSVAAKVIQQGI